MLVNMCHYGWPIDLLISVCTEAFFSDILMFCRTSHASHCFDKYKLSLCDL